LKAQLENKIDILSKNLEKLEKIKNSKADTINTMKDVQEKTESIYLKSIQDLLSKLMSLKLIDEYNKKTRSEPSEKIENDHSSLLAEKIMELTHVIDALLDVVKEFISDKEKLKEEQNKLKKKLEESKESLTMAYKSLDNHMNIYKVLETKRESAQENQAVEELSNNFVLKI
jgi:hypothetical protein